MAKHGAILDAKTWAEIKQQSDQMRASMANRLAHLYDRCFYNGRYVGKCEILKTTLANHIDY